MGDLDAPGVPDGAEDRLLVIPADPTDLRLVLPAEVPRSGCSDPAVYQEELESSGDALLGQVLQHQVAGPVLVGGGRHHYGGHRQADDVDGHDTLDTLGVTVGAAAVVEGKPAVRGTAGEVGVDDDHRGCLVGSSVLSSRGGVQHRQRLRNVPLRDQRRNCDHTRVHGPNDSGR